MIGAVLLLWALSGPVAAQELCEGPPEVCDTLQATEEATDGLGALDVAPMASGLLDVRDPYWYEWGTDVFWLPGEVLAWAGLLGHDHKDAAALGILYALLHQLGSMLWGLVRPIVVRVRAVTQPGPSLSNATRLLIEKGVDRALDVHLQKSEITLNAAKSQITILQNQLASTERQNRILSEASKRILSAAYGAAGRPPGEL